MRRHGRYLPLGAVLTAVLVMLPAAASLETSPTVEAVNEGGGAYPAVHRWSPSAQTVATGVDVAFRNLTTVYHGIHWISGPTPKCSNTVPVGTEASSSAINWSGTCTFTEAGTYKFWCTVHGEAMSGTITVKPPGTPAAATDPPADVTQTGARLGATIKPEGNAISSHFEYGPTSNVAQKFTSAPESIGPDFAEHAVSATLTGLVANTEYHAELVATYGAGKTEVLGLERKFTTPALTAPTVTTVRATGLEQTEATLEGTVDPDGALATEYSFEYGTSSNYGRATAAVSNLPADNITRIVTAKVTGLTPATTYHFRLVAKNEVGPTEGADREFTTLSTPLPPSPPQPPPQPPSPATPPTATTPPPTTPSPFTPPLSKLEEASVFGSSLVAASLQLAAPRHASSVRGSVEVAQAGAGGRLEVDLLAKEASLAKTHGSSAAKSVRVGRLVRQSLSAGKVSFSVALTARGKRALRRHRSLLVTVKVTLTPTQGPPTTTMRNITLRV